MSFTKNLSTYTAQKTERLVVNTDTQNLPDCPWANKVNVIHAIAASATGWDSFKPGSSFNTLTKLEAGLSYVVDIPTANLPISQSINGYVTNSQVMPPPEEFVLAHENHLWRITPRANTIERRTRSQSVWTIIPNATAKELRICSVAGVTKLVIVDPNSVYFTAPVDATTSGQFTQVNDPDAAGIPERDTLDLMSGGGAYFTAGVGRNYQRSHDDQYDWGISDDDKLICKRSQDWIPFRTQWGVGAIKELFLGNHAPNSKPTFVYMLVDDGSYRRRPYSQMRIDQNMSLESISAENYNTAKQTRHGRVIWSPNYNPAPMPTPTPSPAPTPTPTDSFILTTTGGHQWSIEPAGSKVQSRESATSDVFGTFFTMTCREMFLSGGFVYIDQFGTYRRCEDNKWWDYSGSTFGANPVSDAVYNAAKTARIGALLTSPGQRTTP